MFGHILLLGSLPLLQALQPEGLDASRLDSGNTVCSHPTHSPSTVPGAFCDRQCSGPPLHCTFDWKVVNTNLSVAGVARTVTVVEDQEVRASSPDMTCITLRRGERSS